MGARSTPDDGAPATGVTMTATPDYSIAVVVRTLDLLEALAASAEPLGVTELAAQLGTTKSAAYRILATLEQRGYVTKDPLNARYRLGVRLAFLGQQALEGFDLRQAARPLLEGLHSRFHETVNLGVRDGREIVYIDMIESSHGLRMAARLGGRDPITSTALGKAILAYLPLAERAPLLERPLPARTPATVTDAATLAAELARIRQTGVAEDRGENEPGSRCLGAPIFNHQGAVIAAISLTAPDTRLDDDLAAAAGGELKAAAAAITNRIGGQFPR